MDRAFFYTSHACIYRCKKKKKQCGIKTCDFYVTLKKTFVDIRIRGVGGTKQWYPGGMHKCAKIVHNIL